MIDAGGDMPASTDVEGPVQAEVFVLWLHDDRIELTGPCGSDPWLIEVGADEHPLDVVSRVVRDVIGAPILVHSTSWRRDRDAVILSFVVVIDPALVRRDGDEAGRTRRARPVRGDGGATGHRLAPGRGARPAPSRLARPRRPGRPDGARSGLGDGARRLRPRAVPDDGLRMRGDDRMDTPLMARCACGWSVVGTADEIVAATQDHAGKGAQHDRDARAGPGPGGRGRRGRPGGADDDRIRRRGAPSPTAEAALAASTPRSGPYAARVVIPARRRDPPDPEPRACEEPPHEPDRRRRRARDSDRGPAPGSGAEPEQRLQHLHAGPDGHVAGDDGPAAAAAADAGRARHRCSSTTTRLRRLPGRLRPEPASSRTPKRDYFIGRRGWLDLLGSIPTLRVLPAHRPCCASPG